AWQWIPVPKRWEHPIEGARTVFTDAGRKSHRAAITWKENGQWHEQLLSGAPEDSLQTLELAAVVHALATMARPLNIVSDSLYVTGVVNRIEGSVIKEVKNRRLGSLLQ
ncbi:POK6 protein, partial [Tyrannus savana]|nr:POK6 protein [Tyrannus savana]